LGFAGSGPVFSILPFAGNRRRFAHAAAMAADILRGIFRAFR
jgi:hypothetical protein